MPIHAQRIRLSERIALIIPQRTTKKSSTMRYIGLDIGGNICAYAAMLPITGSCETGIIRNPEQLKQLVQPEDHLAAEWTGGIARPWLETALTITPFVFLYHPAQIKADRKHVGEKEKNDFACARTIAKLLQQRNTNPHQPKYLFIPYQLVRESYALRKAIRNARIFDQEIQRIRQIAYFASQSLIEFDANRVLNALEESSRLAWRQAELLITANPEAYRIYLAIKHRFPTAYKTALTLAAYLCPIHRFPTPNALARYLGLEPRRAESGNIKHNIPATTSGAQVPRTAAIQLAMARMEETFQRVKRNDPKRHYLALVAQARIFIHQLWHDAMEGKEPPPKNDRNQRRLKRQNQVLELVRRGLTDADIQKLTGTHASIISRWKKNDPHFAEQYIAAKLFARYNQVPHPEPHSFDPEEDNPHSFDPEGDNPHSFDPEGDNPHSFDPDPAPES
jgi:transposase